MYAASAILGPTCSRSLRKKQRLTLVDEKAPQNESFTASQSPADIAALLRKGQVQVMKNISAVELEDLAIPGKPVVTYLAILCVYPSVHF